MTVVVVTDTSCRLPADLREQWSIRQVPLHILLDGLDLRDGVDEIPDDIHKRHATTAGATPVELSAAYQRALADSGGDGVVAVHISSALSGTFRAAAALAAGRAAAAGDELDTVARAAAAAVSRIHAFVAVARLDNLRRSGRISGAKAWLGTALALKPLLSVDDGKLVLVQRVRTVSNATAVMIDRVCQLVGDRPAALAVHHVADPAAANDVAAALAERLPACEPAMVTAMGPVLALHVGAGAVGVCVDVGASPPA